MQCCKNDDSSICLEYGRLGIALLVSCYRIISRGHLVVHKVNIVSTPANKTAMMTFFNSIMSPLLKLNIHIRDINCHGTRQIAIAAPSYNTPKVLSQIFIVPLKYLHSYCLLPTSSNLITNGLSCLPDFISIQTKVLHHFLILWSCQECTYAIISPRWRLGPKCHIHNHLHR